MSAGQKALLAFAPLNSALAITSATELTCAKSLESAHTKHKDSFCEPPPIVHVQRTFTRAGLIGVPLAQESGLSQKPFGLAQITPFVAKKDPSQKWVKEFNSDQWIKAPWEKSSFPTGILGPESFTSRASNAMHFLNTIYPKISTTARKRLSDFFIDMETNETKAQIAYYHQCKAALYALFESSDSVFVRTLAHAGLVAYLGDTSSIEHSGRAMFYLRLMKEASEFEGRKMAIGSLQDAKSFTTQPLDTLCVTRAQRFDLQPFYTGLIAQGRIAAALQSGKMATRSKL